MRERWRELHEGALDALWTTWIRMTVWPLLRRLSAAHLTACWLPFSLSTASATKPFAPATFTPFPFGSHIFFVDEKQLPLGQSYLQPSMTTNISISNISRKNLSFFVKLDNPWWWSIRRQHIQMPLNQLSLFSVRKLRWLPHFDFSNKSLTKRETSLNKITPPARTNSLSQ